MFDAFLFASSWKAGAENVWLSGGYTFGALCTFVVLLSRGTFAWGVVETASTVLAIACMSVWVIAGPRAAALAGAVALGWEVCPRFG